VSTLLSPIPIHEAFAAGIKTNRPNRTNETNKENKIVKRNVVKTGIKQNRTKQTSQTEKTVVGSMRPKDILAAVPPLQYVTLRRSALHPI
jgi:hypothetical protein